MGQQWAVLTPEQKEIYQIKAAAERERIAKEMEEWKAAGGNMDADSTTLMGPSSSSSPRDPMTLTFPVARIKKIAKLDPEVRGISKEAMLLITKCAELATSKLGRESVKVAQLQNRRKLLPDDVAQVCASREQFTFLKDDVKDLLREQRRHQEEIENNTHTANMTSEEMKSNQMSSAGVTAATAAAAAGTKPLTSYGFGPVQK